MATFEQIQEEISAMLSIPDEDLTASQRAAMEAYLNDLGSQEAEMARLLAERDWLANRLACIQSSYDIDQKTKGWSTECWQEAARRAVAAQKSVVTTATCPACKGKGGAEYEPGLITYACNVWGGTGVIETRRAVGEG